MLTSSMQQSIVQQQDDASMSTVGNIQQPIPTTASRPPPSTPFPFNTFDPADAYTNIPVAMTPAHSMRYQQQHPHHIRSAPFVPYERPLAPTLESTFPPRPPHRPNSTLPRPFIPNTSNAPMVYIIAFMYILYSYYI